MSWGDWAMRVGFVFVFAAVFIRFGWILVGTRRSHRYREGAPVYLATWVQRLNGLEPYVLVVTMIVSAHWRPIGQDAPVLRVAGALLAVPLAAAAIGISLCAIRAFPRVGTGHFILEDHVLVESGPFRWVRHPFYSAVFMLWLSVIAMFPHPIAALLFVAYVLPSYLNYIRHEEAMLLANLGEPYRRYCQRVGRLFPRLRPAVAGPGPDQAGSG